jgi:hypothetical protein
MEPGIIGSNLHFAAAGIDVSAHVDDDTHRCTVVVHMDGER